MNPRKQKVKAFSLIGLWIGCMVFAISCMGLSLRPVFAEGSSEIEIYVGESRSITSFTVEAGIMKASTATWKSGDSAVVRVDSKGLITGERPGTAVVTATLIEGTKIKEANIQIKVKAGVKSVKLTDSKKVIPIAVGDLMTLKYEITLADGVKKSLREGVTWTSDKPDAVSVTPYGVVMGKKPGRYMVYITTNDSQQRDYVYMEVFSTVKGVKMAASEIPMKVGQKETIKVIISPDTAVLKDCKFTSSDTAVVTVDDKGLATAKKEGISYVTATTLDGGYTATARVSVKSMVKNVVINEPKVFLTDAKKTTQLTASLVPVNTAEEPIEKGLTWSSGNSSILSVSSSGLLTAVRSGETYAMVTTIDGGYKAYLYVKVTVTESQATKPMTVLPAEINITSLPENMIVGKKYPLNYEILPVQTTDKSLKGKALSGNCLFQYEGGVLYVTPLTSGRVFINVYHPSGLNKNVDFKVAPSVTGIKLTDSVNGIKDKNLVVYLGQPVTLKLDFENTTDLSESEVKVFPVEWKSTDGVTAQKNSGDSRILEFKMTKPGTAQILVSTSVERYSYTLNVQTETMVKDVILPALVKMGLNEKYRVKADFVLKDKIRYGLTEVQDQGLNVEVEKYYIAKSFLAEEIKYEDQQLPLMQKQISQTTDSDAAKGLQKIYSAHLVRREIFKSWVSAGNSDYGVVQNPSQLIDRELKVIPFFKITSGEISSPISGKVDLKVVSRDGNLLKKMTVETSDQNKELVLLDERGDIISISNTETLAELEKSKKELEAEMKQARIDQFLPEALRKNFTSPISRQEAAALMVLTYEKLAKKTVKKIPTHYYLDTTDGYVDKAYTLGITGKIGNRKFQPKAQISVSEVSSWLARSVKASKAKVNVTAMKDLENWGKTGKGSVTKEQLMEWILKFL